jgi:SAM-dependent methyltransferase
MSKKSDKPISDTNYKSYVGPRKNYDITGANQFSLLVKWGLREQHTLLDLGCGSLRAGKLFIPYLLPHKYFGIDPNSWLIEKAIEFEIGKDMKMIKKPSFNCNEYFLCNIFDIGKFDYILIHSILSHATIEEINRIFKEINHVCEKETQIFLTFISGENDYNGGEWKYPEGVRYTKKTMTKIFENHNFNYQFLKWKHPGNQQWVRLCKKES